MHNQHSTIQCKPKPKTHYTLQVTKTGFMLGVVPQFLPYSHHVYHDCENYLLHPVHELINYVFTDWFVYRLVCLHILIAQKFLVYTWLAVYALMAGP